MKAGIYHLREGSTRSRKGKGEKESLLILFPECLVKLITCLPSKWDSTSERLPSLDCCTRLHLEDGSASVETGFIYSCGKESVYIVIILLELTVQKLALVYRSFHRAWQRQGLVLAPLTEQERLVESLSPYLSFSILALFSLNTISLSSGTSLPGSSSKMGQHKYVPNIFFLIEYNGCS